MDKCTGHVGTLRDGMAHANGMQFSTPDADNDRSTTNCAARFTKSGWWYNECHGGVPTGYYINQKGPPKVNGIWIYGFHESIYNLVKYVEVLLLISTV